jgi:hypothetical protein
MPDTTRKLYAWTEQDIRAIKAIQKRYKFPTQAAAVRYAIHQTATREFIENLKKVSETA